MFIQMCVPSYLWCDMNMQKKGYRGSVDVLYVMLQRILSGIPLLCLWRCNDRSIGSICSHCLDFPAGFLCREILLRSICPLFLLFHKVLNGSTHKNRLGRNVLQESALLQLASVQLHFSQNAEKSMSAAHTGLHLKFDLWGSANSPCVIGISLWFFIIDSGMFYSRPAPSFVTRFIKTLMNKENIPIFAFCGEEPKKGLLFVEMNDQKLWVAFITFPILLQ